MSLSRRLAAPRAVYNAGVKGSVRAFESFFADAEGGEAAARAFVREVLGDIPSTDVVILGEGEMCELGDALVNLAGRFEVGAYDLAIFPLRGGRKLRLILDGMLATHCPFQEVVRPAAIILRSVHGFRVPASPVGFDAANRVISRFSTESLATSPWHRRSSELDRW